MSDEFPKKLISALKMVRLMLADGLSSSGSSTEQGVKYLRLNLWAGFLTLCFLTAGCSRGADKAPTPKTEAKGVRVARAVELAVEQTVYATGSLAAHDRAVLSAKVPGRLESITADLGSAVKKGDLLARIEKRDFELLQRQAEASLAQARARLGIALSGEEDSLKPETSSIVNEARAVLSEAAKNRQRILALREQGVLPDADVETAESAYQVALHRFDEATHEAKNRMATLRLRQAELAMAEQQVKDTEIRAPFDGVVELRQTSPGEFLTVASPILTLVRADPIRLRLEVSEKDAPRVRVGNRVKLQLEGSDRIYESAISRLSPVISQASRMLVAEADFGNPDGTLRPGSFAKADIVVTEMERGIFIEQSAIVTFAGLHKVFVLDRGKAVEYQVTLGRLNGTRVEVQGKVAPGALVVLEPGNLRNGQAVRTVAQET
jgi:RND family efflux transporter MFP subunit